MKEKEIDFDKVQSCIEDIETEIIDLRTRQVKLGDLLEGDLDEEKIEFVKNFEENLWK